MLNRITLIITNLIKLAGLGIALVAPHGAFAQHPETVVLAFGGFLMAGAQLSEQAVANFAERFLALPTKPEHRGEESSLRATPATRKPTSKKRRRK